jgi:excisionase family DNA binding protein
MEDKVYTVREFAKTLKISDGLAYKLIRENRVRSVLIGDRRLIPATVVADILSGQTKLNCQAVA